MDSALTYVGSLAGKLDGPEAALKAWGSLCHILVATNEFLYLE